MKIDELMRDKKNKGKIVRRESTIQSIVSDKTQDLA
jgi:hypothetical protein